jgi:hypothetical protein
MIAKIRNLPQFTAANTQVEQVQEQPNNNSQDNTQNSNEQVA